MLLLDRSGSGSAPVLTIGDGKCTDATFIGNLKGPGVGGMPLKFSPGSSSSNFSFLDNSASTRAVFDTNNTRFGFGTSTPNYTLTVYGTTTVASFQSTTNSTSAFRILNAATTSVLVFDTVNNRLGIATSTPATTLSVAGDTYLDSNVITFASSSAASLTLAFQKSATTTIPNSAAYSWTIATSTGASPIIAINTNSTFATTSFRGGFTVDTDAIQYDFSSGVTSIANLELGDTSFATDAGVVTWTDMLVASTTMATGTINSYIAQIDGTPMLTIYSENAGSGSISTTTVGIGTTTPAWKLTVSNSATTTTKAFIGITDELAGADLKTWTLSSQGGNLYIATSSDLYATSTTPRLTLLSNGMLGIGTSSPSHELAVQGNTYLTGGLGVGRATTTSGVF